jgi:hypothetical protein
MAKWTEVDNETGQTREVELPDELAELVDRALNPPAGYDPYDKMTRRTLPVDDQD